MNSFIVKKRGPNNVSTVTPLDVEISAYVTPNTIQTIFNRSVLQNHQIMTEFYELQSFAIANTALLWRYLQIWFHLGKESVPLQHPLKIKTSRNPLKEDAN